MSYVSRHKPSKLGHQRGVALLVVLLVVAVITLISTDIISRNQIAVRRTINLAEYDQAYWYALSAEELAKKVLKQDMVTSGGRVHLKQFWALSDVAFPAEQGEILGQITDLRTCFNLNALSQPSIKNDSGQVQMPLVVLQFKSLLVSLGLDDFAAEKLSHVLRDYLDADSLTSPLGAEDADYEARQVPYRSANTLMHDKTELRAVIGFTKKIYRVIAPYVCVIPNNVEQLLDINTLKPEQAVLLAGMLENKISVDEAKDLIGQRPSGGFKSTDEFWKLANLGGDIDDRLRSTISIKSRYFLLYAAAKVGSAVFQIETVLQNDNNKFYAISRQLGVQNDMSAKKEN